MFPQATPSQWILGVTLLLTSIGVISAKKPIHASISFLLSLMLLASMYLHLSAEFIGIMQILVYAGAILVIFVFVMVLFQDAHEHISQSKPKSKKMLLGIAGLTFILIMILFGSLLVQLQPYLKTPPEGFGSASGIGKVLYLNFFFPFEAVILLFLVAIVGALFIAKKER